ncbi:DeoR family transcriptional regulator [Alkalihalobacillus sp. TS-13]|uniref:DeoR family transcriptional regulator n=1 Tax=Alkalihalobacillus sp. TS-13 TaxID=2842455 RepID=UPI001C879CBC|nr:DeoR family transcriptional regulator [Alkalihalobacillus sp. TS-13]
MLPIERQQQILTWLQQEGSLKVSEISNRLDVSEMTVYRDLKPLLERGEVEKTSKGISLGQQTTAPTINACTYCHKTDRTRHSVQLITKHQTVENTCCPHCGLLRYEDIKEEVSQILCSDFLQDTTISAKMATFLLKPNINLNCCHPQVIAFGSLKQAQQFQKGFGGELYSFTEAIDAIENEMNHTCNCK